MYSPFLLTFKLLRISYKKGEKLNKYRYFTYLACGFIVFLVSIYGFILIQGRLKLPPDISIQRLLRKEKSMVKSD